MYIQWFAKGIEGRRDHEPGSLPTMHEAFAMVTLAQGIFSNWWRAKQRIKPEEIAQVLTETNLDRHLHAYTRYGAHSPFISVAAGCVELACCRLLISVEK